MVERNPLAQTNATVLRAKQRTYRYAAVLAAVACAIPMVVTVTSPGQFRWLHLGTNGVALLLCLICWLLLGQPGRVRLIERIMLGGIVGYIGSWNVLNLLTGRIPDTEAIVGGAPAFLLACILSCLILPNRLQRGFLLGLYGVNFVLTWANLLRYPWSDLHTLQFSTDIVVLVSVLLLSMIGLYQKLMQSVGREANELRDLANTDQLTGLANRRAMYELLEGTSTGAMALIDLDNFKVVNDTYGHQHGDEVLVQVAKALSTHAEGVGTVGRWGGEEFLVLLPALTLEQAGAWAERARATVEKLPGTETTLSIGIAVRRPRETYARQLHRADALLYSAKEAGKNRVMLEAIG